MNDSTHTPAKTEAVCMAIMPDGRICGAPAVKVREGRTLCAACASRIQFAPEYRASLQLGARAAAFTERLSNHLQARGVHGADRDQIILAILEGVAQSDIDLTGAESLIDIITHLRMRLS